MRIYLTNNEKKVLEGFVSILKLREDEPSNHKKINVNAHSIAQHQNMNYNTVKNNLRKLKEKVCS